MSNDFHRVVGAAAAAAAAALNREKKSLETVIFTGLDLIFN